MQSTFGSQRRSRFGPRTWPVVGLFAAAAEERLREALKREGVTRDAGRIPSVEQPDEECGR